MEGPLAPAGAASRVAETASGHRPPDAGNRGAGADLQPHGRCRPGGAPAGSSAAAGGKTLRRWRLRSLARVPRSRAAADRAHHLAEKERQYSPARQLRRRSLAARRKPAANPPLGSPRLETQSGLPSPQPGGDRLLANQTELRREPQKPPPGQPENGSCSEMQTPQPFRAPRTAKIRLDQLGDKAS